MWKKLGLFLFLALSLNLSAGVLFSTVSYGMIAGEGREDSETDRLETLKAAADTGDAQVQYKYARALRDKGDAKGAVQYFRKAADQGHVKALYEYGDLFRFGELDETDEFKGYEIIREAAKQGYRRARVALGIMTLFGEGCDQDLKEAWEIFEELAAESPFREGDDGSRAYFIGELWSFEGDDQVLAEDFLGDLAKSGDPWGQLWYGKFLYEKNTDQKSHDKAVKYLMRAADNGEIEALVLLGEIFSSGKTGRVDLERARDYFRRAAQAGDLNSQVRFGKMLKKGEGGSEDLVLARKFFRVAARNGQTEAQIEYGQMLLSGKGGRKSEKSARKYFEMALFDDQGRPYQTRHFPNDLKDLIKKLRFFYVKMLIRGEGGPKDLRGAYELLKFVADHDLDAQAQVWVAKLLAFEGNSLQVPDDSMKIREYLEKAAAQKYPEAELTLGELLRYSNKREEHPVAIQHFLNAAEYGHPSAKKLKSVFRRGGSIPSAIHNRELGWKTDY